MTFDVYARRQAQILFDAFAERLVKDLSNAAREEAQASAAQARQEAEQAAETALAMARAGGDARLAAAQAMNAGLLDSVEAAREEVRTTQAAAQEGMRTTHAAAEEDVRTAQAAASAEIARLRAELEARLEEREHALHAARRDASLAKEAFEDARQESIFARIEADGCRQDRELLVERVGVALSAIDRATSPSDILAALLEPLGHEFARAAVFLVGPSSLNGWRACGLDSTTDIANVVMLRSNDSILARAVTERKRLYMTATPQEPLVGLLGPAGSSTDPVRRVVALPVLAGEQVIAVAYAEDGGSTSNFPGSLTIFPDDTCKIAEMLIDHAMLRLMTKRVTTACPAVPPDVQPAAYSPARQARRLRVQKGIDVTLDGAESSLVDLSSIGAQIVSPLAMPPNRMVKMTLRTKDAALACKGRVIWARFEQPRGTAAARYRVGLKFTDIEEKALETLMTRHGIAAATR